MFWLQQKSKLKTHIFKLEFEHGGFRQSDVILSYLLSTEGTDIDNLSQFI